MATLSTLHVGSYAPGTAANPLTILGSGTITASSGYALSLVSGTNWYVLNQGLITASSGDAVDMVTGTIVNQGWIGGTHGVVVTGGGTVVNGGTIVAGTSSPGTYLDAVTFAAGYYNKMILEPGSSIVGTVDGGNTIGAAQYSELVLGAGAYTGTLQGLNTQFTNFATISLANGASWALAGDVTIETNQIFRGSYAAIVQVGPTLVNDGSFLPGISFAASGVYISNARYGYLAGNYGVIGTLNAGAAATIVNSGFIYGDYAAVSIGGYAAKSEVINNQYGTIGQNAAITMAGGVVLNRGTIFSSRYDGVVGANGPGASPLTVLNSGTILAASGRGVDLGTGGTVDNAGTIVAGTSSPGVYLDAVTFAAGYNNAMIVDPGAVFKGTIDGGNTIGAPAVSTLEFGAGIGTLSGFGAQVTNFAQVTLDAGAQWNLAGSAAGFDSGETISGFAAGSTLELVGTSAAYGSLGGGVLTLTGGITIDLPGAAHVNVATASGNTYITACFASGTRIAGAFGAVPVEALRVGDLVRTARGRLAPVRWIGHRRTALAKHPRPLDVMPVRVRAGAFGEGVPARDLVLSPDHAVFVDGKLVPIRYLINGRSIVQERRAVITYWHVELDRHDIILAEGMACESYLDTGNRGAFENAPDAVQMTPAFARAVWAREGCAPIVTDTADPWLRRLHTRLLAAAERGVRAA